MLQIVLLAGKFAFLIILYLFIYGVIRSSTRELRLAAPKAKGAWQPEVPATVAPAVAGGETKAGKTAAAKTGTGTWTLVVEASPTLSVGAAYGFSAGMHALAGRSGDMDIHLDDTFVSSKHALFEATAAGLQVEDLRSTNGTQVNGEDVTGTRPLQVGDRVEVGDTVFRVEVR
jgi:hypothetical protein